MRVQSEDRKNVQTVIQNYAVGRAIGNVITRSAGMKQSSVCLWLRNGFYLFVGVIGIH